MIMWMMIRSGIAFPEGGRTLKKEEDDDERRLRKKMKMKKG
jgi:hypothetical protein